MDKANGRVIGLDALRAVAILLVIISHYSLGRAFVLGLPAPAAWVVNAGFFGVSLFFQLSGFLIGHIIMDIADRGFTMEGLRRFWIRRWLRTVPSYWVMLVALIFMAGTQAPTIVEQFRFATLTQNVVSPYPGEFYAVSWSLVVEEWFYLIFPVAFFSAAAMAPKRGQIFVILAFILAPILLRYVAWYDLHLDKSAGIRKIAVLQMDSIAYGSLVAYIMRRISIPAIQGRILGAIGIIAIAATWYLSSTATADSGFWISNGRFIFSGISGALIVCGASKISSLPRGAKNASIFFSKTSYTLYLVHVPAFEISNRIFGSMGPLVTYAALGISLILSIVLTKTIELPFMRIRPKQFPSTEVAGLSRQSPM